MVAAGFAPAGDGSEQGAVHMKKFLPIVPLLFLAACDNSPKVEAENASIEEVADKVREANEGKAMIVRPGQWESSVELESIEVPGMPPEAVAQMKKTMARVATGHKTCLTKEQAMKPKEDFFAGKNSNCRYDKFSMDDGKMTGTMRCTNPQGGGSQLIDFNGTYSPDSYEMRMASTVEGASPGGPMKMVMRMSSKRTGECDGSEMKVATN
jgi:hypothetical protein